LLEPSTYSEINTSADTLILKAQRKIVKSDIFNSNDVERALMFILTCP
jgi:hypothetical protein